MPRTVPWYCANPRCPEYDAAAMIRELYDTGAWWPVRTPMCAECGAELEPERPAASALDDHSS